MSRKSDQGGFGICPTCCAPVPAGYQGMRCPSCISGNQDTETGEDSAAYGSGRGSATACIGLGVIALCVGLYFLLNPGSGGYRDIVNMHALAMGQAFTVAGAVLLGFGIRPR